MQLNYIIQLIENWGMYKNTKIKSLKMGCCYQEARIMRHLQTYHCNSNRRRHACILVCRQHKENQLNMENKVGVLLCLHLQIICWCCSILRRPARQTDTSERCPCSVGCSERRASRETTPPGWGSREDQAVANGTQAGDYAQEKTGIPASKCQMC